jgi:hypothetical protein
MREGMRIGRWKQLFFEPGISPLSCCIWVGFADA